MRRQLTALIPAHNDDYTLDLCLRSIVEAFDEIIVLDDASTDHTADVVHSVAAGVGHVRYLRNDGPQLGWIEARNRLLEASDSDCLFFIDSDDVLCEYNAELLARVAADHRRAVRLQLCELWGDLNHSTQRLRHYDRCHVFCDRRALRELIWSGGSAARPSVEGVVGRSGGPLFVHIKGCKPDRRLVQRQFMRAWLRAGKPGGSLEAWARLDELPLEELHRRAVRMLLRSKQDLIRPTYVGEMRPRGVPRRPAVIEAEVRAGARFEMVYDGGRAVDRVDRGWQAPPVDGTDHGPAVEDAA